MNDVVVSGALEIGEAFHMGPVNQPKGAWVIYGGQAGSEGKGAVVGYLARRAQWGAAICTFMTNAGHTWKDGDNEVVVQQLPMALVNPDIPYLLVGPSSVITVEQLLDEIERYDDDWDIVDRLRIHPRAMILEPEHEEWEKENLEYIASTMKGCGAARADKVRRRQGVRLARDVGYLDDFIADTTEIANNVVNAGGGLLVEGSQGFDLSINHGIDYPHCTSRQCGPAQVMADIGVDGRMVSRSIAVVRTYPIRVGNVERDGEVVGESGPFGSEETDWDALTAESGADAHGEDLIERTTVTKRVRRVFEMDFDRLGYMSMVTRPTDIALTFADYLDRDLFGWNNENLRGRSLPRKVQHFIHKVEKSVVRPTSSPRVNLIKTGPGDTHMIDWMGFYNG